MAEEASEFVELYLAHGDEWERALYEAVGRVAIAGAAVEGALFSLAMQLAPTDELYGARITDLLSTIQSNVPALSPSHQQRCRDLLSDARQGLKQRNVVVHLTWHAIPLHEDRHLGVGTRRAPDGEGLIADLRSADEMSRLGGALHDVALGITEFQRVIANPQEDPAE